MRSSGAVTPSSSVCLTACVTRAAPSIISGAPATSSVRRVIRPPASRGVFIAHLSFIQHFPHKLPDLGAQKRQRPPSGGGDAVVFAHFAAHHTPLFFEIALVPQGMERGVHRAWAELIPVPGQLLDHRRAVD